MAYKLAYGHTFNTGNYTSDHVSLEEEFSNEVPKAVALKKLETEVLNAWRSLGKQEVIGNANQRTK